MNSKAPFQDLKNMYRCCCCCHVRTATIVLAVYWMVICGLMLILQTVDVANGKGFCKDFQNEYYKIADITSTFLLIITLFIISFCLLYGALKHRERLLVPFLVLQVLDFSLSVLAVFSSYVDLPAHLYFKDRLVFFQDDEKVSPEESTKMMIISTVVFVIFLIVKAYLIDCVWTCYKYIKARNEAEVRMYPMFELPEKAMLPTYDEAVMLPPKQAPPPYTEA